MSVTFEDFVLLMPPPRKVPMSLLRSYYEAGKLAGAIGQTPWAWSEAKELPDLCQLGPKSPLCAQKGELPLADTNFEQCGVESRNATSQRSGVESKNGMAEDQSGTPDSLPHPLAGLASGHCSKIIPAQFVKHGLLEKQPPNPSKGPLKIKKWMLR